MMRTILHVAGIIGKEEEGRSDDLVVTAEYGVLPEDSHVLLTPINTRTAHLIVNSSLTVGDLPGGGFGSEYSQCKFLGPEKSKVKGDYEPPAGKFCAFQQTLVSVCHGPGPVHVLDDLWVKKTSPGLGVMDQLV